MLIKCEHCGVLTEKTHWRKRYCSEKCVNRACFLRTYKKKGYASGVRNSYWKGDRAGYIAFHMWLRKNHPPPSSCQSCGEPKQYLELAFKWHGIKPHTRDIADYEWLCKSCHTKKDIDRVGYKGKTLSLTASELIKNHRAVLKEGEK